MERLGKITMSVYRYLHQYMTCIYKKKKNAQNLGLLYYKNDQSI